MELLRYVGDVIRERQFPVVWTESFLGSHLHLHAISDPMTQHGGLDLLEYATIRTVNVADGHVDLLHHFLVLIGNGIGELNKFVLSHSLLRHAISPSPGPGPTLGQYAIITQTKAANHQSDPEGLRQIDALMSGVLEACPDYVRNDLEQINPVRPWLILHLNRSITATRTCDPATMGRAFDDFIQALPNEASRCFTEGMGEMDRLGYPPRVRQFMLRYDDRFARKRMN